MHKIPLTKIEREGLINHGLPVGKPSQLSDAFRHGVKWALDNAVPEGWKLVPIEPTHEMFCAGYHELEKCELIESIYKAMLEAAPKGVSND